MLIVPPSPIDMASLIGCKNWIGTLASGSNGTDANIQACITAASMYFVRETGRGPRNWQTFTKNPFNQTVDYVETYDGTAGLKLFLRNFPVNSASSVSVAGVAVKAGSASTQSPGYVVDDQGRSLVMIGGGGGASPQTFAYVNQWGNGFTAGATPLGGFRPWGAGPQQIQVSYNAGFNPIPVVGALNTVIGAWTANATIVAGQQVSDGFYLQTAKNSGTAGATAPVWAAFTGSPVNTTDNGVIWQNTGIQAPPNTILIQSDVAILSDQGVSYFSSGTPLTKVNISPAVGEYFLVAPGVYLFNVADAGLSMLVSYTLAGTPQDAVLAIFQLVALNYVRRNWIGMRQQVMKDVGSTTYTLDVDPTIKRVISNYKRENLAS